MENPNLVPGALRAKRKCEDNDAVLELLNGVSLSPHTKRLRQELGSTSYSNTPMDVGYFDTACSNAYPSADGELVGKLPSDQHQCRPPEIDLLEQPSEPLHASPVNDERAIVLYKPVNTPLFPGGPSAGSQLMLNAHMLSSGVLDASNLLRGRNNAELSWLKTPSNGVRITELSEEAEQLETSRDCHLAVVPWVPHLAMSTPILQTSGQSVIQDIENMCGENLDVEAMDEDTESSMDFVISQPGNNASFFYEPWQQYGAPRPQYSSIMRSY